MARKILIASGKGGVGKSTAASALGRIFAAEGLKTLLVDCDAGLSSLDILLDCRESANFSWYDAYLERCNARDAIISPAENLFLMPSPENKLDEAAEDSVKKITDQVEKDFDIIIYDAPAGIGRGLIRAANAATQALVIATADEVSVSGAAKLDREIRKAGIKQSRLLINRYDIKAAKKGRLLTVDEIIDRTFVQLIGIIPEDKDIMYSTVTKKMPKRSKSEKAFRRISQRIQGKNIELTLSLLK